MFKLIKTIASFAFDKTFIQIDLAFKISILKRMFVWFSKKILKTIDSWIQDFLGLILEHLPDIKSRQILKVYLGFFKRPTCLEYCRNGGVLGFSAFNT